jgi:hypothetical protein
MDLERASRGDPTAIFYGGFFVEVVNTNAKKNEVL